MFLFFIAVALIGVMFFTRAGKKEKTKGSVIQFFTKGKEAGFSIRELEQIRKLAANCNIDDPATIFTSQKHLEICIKSVVNAVRMSGDSESPGIQDFLSRLFDYCKEVGIRNAEQKTTITNTRQISEGQVLRVLVPGTGVFRSEVIKNIEGYLTVSRPVNQKSSSSMQWSGLRISVYFWREDDAGYVFDSEVLDEVFSKGISAIKIVHNDSLFRTQKRKSLRVKIYKSAFLYMVNNEDPHRLETVPGLRCKLEDISDTGCAFRVKGQASIGLRFKVQFSLDRIPICIPGTVRSIDYLPEDDISILHMEADVLPIATRNHILCEVFDMLPDDDDDEVPFRVQEDNNGKEAENG
ncbi:MAG: PilZ domain-containing protein [Treponema sp.]|jgi:c-di-GMP-binding flagellar brake protein YcgR|nr:PilZ domain-containing protein [Treponema sp.]